MFLIAATILVPITLVSPSEYQVFQRVSATKGSISVSGRVGVACDRVECRIEKSGWIRVPLKKGAGGFARDIGVRPGGWYRVQLRAMKGDVIVGELAVEHVGLGEVFVGAGQSNSTNCGGEGSLKTDTRMVSTYSGKEWRIADDPQPGVHDNSMGGSFWPAFGDAMFARYRVPIGLAVTGHGGTSVNQWQKGGELFEWTLTRVKQLGRNGFRALLWHQGESDVAMPSDEYKAKLAQIIKDSKEAAGWSFPWFIARVSYHNPEQALFDSTRNAQKALWDSGVALEGPDTDTLVGDNRDAGGRGIHFSPKGLKAHGRAWADKVSVWLDKVLK